MDKAHDIAKAIIPTAKDEQSSPQPYNLESAKRLCLHQLP